MRGPASSSCHHCVRRAIDKDRGVECTVHTVRWLMTTALLLACKEGTENFLTTALFRCDTSSSHLTPPAAPVTLPRFRRSVFGALPQLELQLSQIPSREMALLQLLQHRASPVLGKDGVARWWAYRRGLEKLLRQYHVVRRPLHAHAPPCLYAVSSPAFATVLPARNCTSSSSRGNCRSSLSSATCSACSSRRRPSSPRLQWPRHNRR